MRFSRLITAIAPLLLILACSTIKPTTEDLMVTPEVVQFIPSVDYQLDDENISKDHLAILFATGRVPAPEDAAVPFLNERDTLLHLGEAYIEVINEDVNWEDLREADKLEELSGKYTLGLSGIADFGPLDDTLHEFIDPKRIPEDREHAPLQFAAEINKRLAHNRIPEIVIFVHGVNSAFESPLIFAAEFTHFLDYSTVPIAFSWASGQSLMNYISDVDTAEYTATQFRHFLSFLLRETNAEKVHIIAYSAGTKLVGMALHQLALIGTDPEETEIRGSIGRIHFIAGDIERQLFGMYIVDGLPRIVESTTIYMSETDQALKASETIRKYPRLGQTWEENTLTDEIRAAMKALKITFIDVTGLEGSKSDSGHGYFRTSPWVSSDLMISAGLGIDPGDRGLEYSSEKGYWSFSEDYISRLTDFAESYGDPEN